MKIKKLFSVTSLITVLLLLIGAVLFFGFKRGVSAPENKNTVFLTGSEDAVIAKDKATSYKIIFSADGFSGDQELAALLKETIYSKYKANAPYYPDTRAEDENEILIGATNRVLSEELISELNYRTGGERVGWGIIYRDGKLAFAASSDEAFNLGKRDLLAFLGDTEFSVPSDIYYIKIMTRAEFDAEVKLEEEKAEAEKEAQRQQKIEEYKKLNASFDDSRFGKSTAVFDASAFDAPHAYPTVGEHPRVNLTAYMIDDIKSTLEMPEMKDMKKLFWESANMQTTGILKKPNIEISTTYNWDSEILTAIEAKALAYLLTGDELYAQEAIYGIKNYILTLVMTTDAQGDLFYAYGSVMRVAGEVYDWCYPVLTEKDKEQIIAGVENHHAKKMTVGCPPVGMNGIQGHGTSSAIAVDYLAFSIAIYDERPDWWELVGGRVYNEWYPFINYYFQSGYWNQGTATYADNKTAYQCRSAWLIKVLTGENPLPNFDRVLYGLLANELPTGYFFSTGDGTVNLEGTSSGAFTLDKTIVVLQALCPSENMQLLAKIYLKNYTKTYMTFSGYPYTVSNVLIWRSQGSKTTADAEHKYDEIGTVSHAPFPVGQIIARTEWSCADAPVVFMKIGELNVGNHEHEDSGTFQIYYKGLLTGNTGYYGGSENSYNAPYGSTHHKYYHQATISSNGFLVFNPALAGEDPSVPDKYYYCGGQISTVGTESFEQFLNEPTTKKGTTTGYSYEYLRDGKTPKYAYIAGDISLAYNPSTVDFIERRMLSIFTGNEKYPMFFYVFDNVISKSPDFTKTFLLHTAYEPTVDGAVVTSTVGDGKLVLTALNSEAAISKVGGEGNWFLVNGHPCSPSETQSKHWGRVEISTSGTAYTGMLNAMYVTDATNEDYLETTLLSDTELFIAAKTDNVVVVFTKGNERNAAKIDFSNTGNGLFEYYVSGMSVGSWTAKVDGVAVANLYSYEESGFLRFTAPSGNVELVPGDDVKPANSGIIRYNLSGSTLPEGTPEFYIYDEPFTLPTPIPPTALRYLRAGTRTRPIKRK